jgi:hypothetical protein
MKIKSILLLLFCKLSLLSQNTYYVNDIDYAGNTPNSFANILTIAQSDLSNGINVVINLNVAGGLIRTDPGFVTGNFYFLLSLSGPGKLTIQKDPTATVDQGFIAHNYTSPLPTISNGLWVISLPANSGLKLSKLKFKDLGNGLRSNNNPVNNLEVSDCVFEDVLASIGLTNFNNVLIKNNQCYTTVPGSFGFFFAGDTQNHLTSVYQCVVEDNTIVGNGSSVNGTGIAFECLPSVNTPIQSTDTYAVYVRNNVISNTSFAFQWLVYVNNNTYNNANMTLEITNNAFNNNAIGSYFINPLKTTRFDGNIFNSNTNNDLYIQAFNFYAPSFQTNNFGLDLIGPNSLGLTPFNANNVFSNNSARNITVAGANLNYYSSAVNIIGLDLPKNVVVNGIGNAKIQENKIQTLVPDKAIDLVGSGNAVIDGPTITSANLSSGNVLTINYNVNTVQHLSTSAPFQIEFYRCNSNGSLLDFIGRETRNSPGSAFNYVVTLPSSLVFGVGDKLGATVTSYGTNSGATAKGTSQVTYAGSCNANIFPAVTPACVNTNIQFNLVSICSANTQNPNNTYLWNFGNGAVATGTPGTTVYNAPGTYQVQLSVTTPGSPPVTVTYNQSIQVNPCQPPQTCANCIGSFAPDPGEYMISLWVREDISPTPLTYNNPQIKIDFTGDPTIYTFGTDVQKNKIIEGWQRIEEPFTIPVGATYLNLNLLNNNAFNGADVYFDDIRIFPKDGQMKTYVYDPVTLRLASMLDENNYATFYEYDEEGKLIRIKKETEKGIMTIQENREGIKKQ